MSFLGPGRMVGGVLTEKEARARQQWEQNVANQLRKQKLDESVAMQMRQEEMAKLEASPAKKNQQRLAGMKARIAAAEAMETACLKIERDAKGLQDNCVQFMTACNSATDLQDLTDQISARDGLRAEYLALGVILDGYKLGSESFAYKGVKIQWDRALRLWNVLEQMIQTRVEAEKESYRKAREQARDAELEAQIQKAIAEDKSARGKASAKAPKAREAPVFKAPDEIAAAGAAVQAIYAWAYGHATDHTHANWRAAYQDPLGRPLGPSYPASETITFPGGVRNIVRSAARRYVSMAEALEAGRLWTGQTMEVAGGALGRTTYLSATTAPHDWHINLVLEDGNRTGRPSVLNLHVYYA